MDDMQYIIKYSKQVNKQIEALPKRIRETITEKIEKLAISPQQSQNVKALQGEDYLYRLRVGDYRVIYRLEHGELVVLVLKVQHRKDVYR